MPFPRATPLPGVVAGARHSLALRRASTSRQLECPCGNLPFVQSLKIRQRVGCGNLLTLNLGEMSIAVERERFTGTAKQLRNPILHIFMCGRKLYLSGGNS